MRKTLILLTILAFATRLTYQSNYLEDWDSVQFAMALHDYSLADGIPHPPGYPLYILLGKFFLFFLHDDNKSLTIMSVIFGSACVIPLFLLAKKLFSSPVAILSSLIYIVAPVEWTLSEVGLTNIPGQFFLMTLLFLLYISFRNEKKFISICFFLGLMLGLRFTEASVVVALICFFLMKFRQIRLTFLAIISLLLGVLIWMIPLILITGPDKFIQVYFENAAYIFRHDTLLGSQVSLLSLFKSRIISLNYLLVLGYGKLFLTISLLAIIWLILKKRYKDLKYKFLIFWIVSYLIPLVLFFNLEVVRYTLPLFIPLTLITSSFIFQFFRRRTSIIISFGLIFFLLSQAFHQVREFKETVPPAIQSVYFIKKNFDPAKTIIIPTLTLRHFQYYAPEYVILNRDNINENLKLNNKIVILDYPGTKDKLFQLKDYHISDKKEFFENKDIFNRVSHITLYILKHE